jgi:protein involved in polysaccharide export with SLBB domain
MIWVRSFPLLFVGLLAGGLGARAVEAQLQSAPPVPLITRAELTAKLHAADSTGRKEEAFLLRTRLQNGDFEVGDRININYDGFVLKGGDSVMVLAGRIIRLREPMGDLNVSGLLRSELLEAVSTRVAKYFKNTIVRVSVPLRLSISGAVRLPGFYYFPVDSPLSDLIMRTGGQDPSADLKDVVIKRGDQVLWTNEDVQAALGDGITLERLNLEPGDEIIVGAKHQSNIWTILQVSIGLLGVILSFYRFSR